MMHGKYYFLVFAISVLFCSSWCSNEITESWLHHSLWVDYFKCQNPQARGLELSEFLEPNDPLLLHIENVYPSMTVLHRCENAGCCSGMKLCTPKETESVNLIFGIVQPGLSKIEYAYRNVINHTSCSCELKKSIRENKI